jgi:DNA-nicking Smr family endonuclease
MPALRSNMAGRLLSPEEQALWQALVKTVRPMRRAVPAPVRTKPEEAAAPLPVVKEARVRGRVPAARRVDLPVPARPAPVPVLDSSWEKQIRGGRLVPDISIDLHGLTLAAAHLRLDRLLADATRPLPGESGKRGAIRAEIGDWLARSSQASRIASVRSAHPRHGGDGALYIILRRREGE